MEVIDHAQQPTEDWRPGVTTRMCISARTGAQHLTVFEQWVEPGLGAPEHRHSVEEIGSVLVGKAEVFFGGESAILTEGQSVVIPAGVRHSFLNCGSSQLKMRFILAAPVFEAMYGSSNELTRRWLREHPQI